MRNIEDDKKIEIPKADKILFSALKYIDKSTNIVNNNINIAKIV
jgi:hypothetical protein